LSLYSSRFVILLPYLVNEPPSLMMDFWLSSFIFIFYWNNCIYYQYALKRTRMPKFGRKPQTL